MNTLNFIYFTANFTHNFILKVWSNNLHLANHLQSKFENISNNGCITSGDFLKWFFQLSSDNQLILIEWVNTNYKAF